MIHERSHPIQNASLQKLKQRQREMSKRHTTPLMRTKSHFTKKAQSQEASTDCENVIISVPDGVKYVKGPLMKIWERFILLTESKPQIFGVKTFDAHGSAYQTLSLLKVMKFCEHFGFLNENLVTPGEVATLFAQCTRIHSSFDHLMRKFHCEEFLQQKRMVNSEFHVQDFLNFIVRLAVLMYSRPPFKQANELTSAEKVKAFISKFRLDDGAYIQKVLNEAKAENDMKTRQGTFLKKRNGILNSVRSNFEALGESENRFLASLNIEDAELLPLMEILVLEKPAYRAVPNSKHIEAKKVKIGASYVYKVSVRNEKSSPEKFTISTRDSHVVSVSETEFILAPGISKNFFVKLIPIGPAWVTIDINNTKIHIELSV